MRISLLWFSLLILLFPTSILADVQTVVIKNNMGNYPGTQNANMLCVSNTSGSNAPTYNVQPGQEA